MAETILRIPGKLVADEYGTKLANVSDLDNDVYGPYASVSAAHAALQAKGLNIVGTTVGISGSNNTVVEYWYQGGTAQANLVEKSFGGGGITIDPVPTEDSSNAVASGGVYDALEEKQEKLVSGLNIKTINGQSIVGEGNLVTESDTVPFDGFILLSPITIIDGSVVDPDAILYYRDVNRFVAKKGDKYYNNWADRLLYNNGNAPYTSKLYPYDGAVYTWDGTTFAATGGTSVRYDAQTLTTQQKEQAAQNIGLDVVVKGDMQQSLSDAQKVQAQNNMMGKAYAPAQFSGFGKKVFAKNVQDVGGVNKNIITQAFFEDEQGNLLTNTVFVIQYDYELAENITVPANCVLEFDGGTLSYGSYTLNGNICNLVVYQSWFKTIDDFFKFINNVDGPVRYEFTPGEYTATTKVDKNVDSAIVIEGNGAKVNWTPAVANSLGRVFSIHPRDYNSDILYPSVNITAAINSGEQTFTVADASGFSVGDILALKDNKTSSFFWSRNYQEGEFVKIQKINGTTITVDKPITGDYINVGYLAATKAPMKKCIINNLHLNQTEGQNIITYGLYVFLMSGEMNNVSVTNFQYNIEAWCCWNFNVNNCFAANPEINYNGRSTDGYALCVNNCQNLKVIGGRFTGNNHGLATGGYYDGKYAIINRFIIYENIETACTVTGGKTDSIETHDDSDYITVKNCVASGIALGGKHHTVTNCKCYRIAIAAGNSFEHTITDNIVKYEIEVQMYDHSGSYEYAYGNTKSIDHNESLLVYGNICGTMIIQNRCTESRYDMTKLNVYVKNNVIRSGRGHCYFNLTSIISSTDLDNAASIVLVDNIVDTNSFNFQIRCNSALLLDNKINAKQFITIINTVAIENCFITTTDILKPYLYKSIRIVRSRFSADYLNMDITRNTVTDIVVEDCIFETTNIYFAIRCTSEMNDTNTNIRCVGNFVNGNVAKILRIDKVSGVTGGTKTLIFYNNKKNNGEDAGIDNQISTDLVQNIAVGQMRWNSTKPEWWNGTAWVDATGATV